MVHLIDKSVVEAEIERRLEFVEKRLKRNNSYTEEGNIAWERDKALYDAYNSLLYSLDTLEVKELGVDFGDPKGDKSAKCIIDTNTLEVKEVDLEKETKKWWKEHLHLNPENKLWMNAHQSIVFAKHFYELGLKAQKGEEV